MVTLALDPPGLAIEQIFNGGANTNWKGNPHVSNKRF
jgi:hypothetical protein